VDSSTRLRAVTVPPSSAAEFDPTESREFLFERLQWLMFVRVLVVSVLFGVLVFLRQQQHESIQPITTLYPIVIAAYASSLLYGLVANRMPNLTFFTYLQFGVDAACIGLVLVFTGGQDSVFTWLFVFNVFGGGYLLLLRGGLVVASFDTVVYLLCLYAGHRGWVSDGQAAADGFSGSPLEILQAYSTIGFHIVSFYLIAFLSGSLASKQAETGRALARASISLFRLKDIHGRIVQNIDAGLLTVDPAGLVTSFNRAAESITLCSADVVLGQPVELVLGDVKGLLDPSLGDRSPRRGERGVDRWITRSDGRRVYLRMSVSELRTPQGRVDGHILVFEDRTRLLLMQERLEREERLAAVGRLAAGIAHEIRNPLASINGSVQVLRAGLSLEVEDDELFGIIEAECERLDHLVSDFLSLTREERLKLVPQRIGPLVRETLTLLEARGYTDSITVESEIEFDPIIEVDAERIRQVLWNLVNNACQSMAGRGGTLRVGLERARNSDLGRSPGVAIEGSPEDSLGETYLARDMGTEQDGDSEVSVEVMRPAVGDSLRRPPGPWGDADVLRLVVADTGPGVPEDAISRIFDPFYTTRSGGTGLGLVIVQRIVQAHRGVITVQTRAGKGTRFAVWLPVRRFGPTSDVAVDGEDLDAVGTDTEMPAVVARRDGSNG
jgi:two-component system sensor histidine kinase PilS (NtrC family)